MLAAAALTAFPTFYLLRHEHLVAALWACAGMSLAGLALLTAAITDATTEAPVITAAAVLALAIHGVLMLLIVKAAMAAASEDAEQTF